MCTLMCMTEIGRDVDAFNCRKSANFPIYLTEVGTRHWQSSGKAFDASDGLGGEQNFLSLVHLCCKVTIIAFLPWVFSQIWDGRPFQDKLTPITIADALTKYMSTENDKSNLNYKFLDKINQWTDIWGGDVHKYTADLWDWLMAFFVLLIKLLWSGFVIC